MKTIAVFFAIVAVTLAAPRIQRRQANNNQDVYLVSETPSDNIGLDGYRFAYQLSDGQSREESAQVETRSADDSVLRVQGSYSWTDPADGQVYTVTYYADETGYHAEGAHLPVAPVA